MTDKDNKGLGSQIAGMLKGRSTPAVDPAVVRELAALLDETGLTEIEIEQSGTRVRVVRTATAVAQFGPVLPAGSAVATLAPAEPAPEQKKGTVVSSPMVGTIYLSPQPGVAPFVKVGDTIKDDQTVVIVEAMKTMNQVPAGVSGKVIEIYVRDGQPVEFGEPLILID